MTFWHFFMLFIAAILLLDFNPLIFGVVATSIVMVAQWFRGES